jgi:PAS domain S-box-containing protein
MSTTTLALFTLQEENRRLRARVEELELAQARQPARPAASGESEQQFRNLADTAPVMIWVASPDKLCTFFNKGWLEFTGRAMEQELGDGWAAGVHPDDRKRCFATYSSAFDARRSFAMEYRLRRADGQYRWVLDNGIPNYSQSQFAGYIGSCVDVTDQKRTEQRLRESEERLKNAERLAHVGNWVWDVKDDRVCWSAEIYRIFGIPQDQLPAYDQFLQAILPEDRERVAQSIRDCLAEKSGHAVEFRIARPDGAVRTVASISEVLRDETGAPERVIGAYQDVTPQKLTEAALRESEERFRNMADTAPVMIWIAGSDGLFTFFNKTWLDFAGRTMEQEIGNGWREGIHPDDRGACYQRFYAAFGARQSFRFERRMRRADGEYRWVLCTGLPRFENGSFTGYIGSDIDITDVKHAQEESFHRQKLESLGVLTSGIAHDFNNLLGGVLAQAELALDELAEDARPEEELRAIRAAAIGGSEIVRQLMVFAGQESESLELVDTSRVVEEMIELLKASVSKRAVLEADLEPNLPLVRASRAHIRQVVMNFVINASEALGEREGVIRVTTARVPPGSDASADGCIELAVADSGCGIPPDVQARVFDPFFSTKSAGRGLGLAVVERISRSLHGTLRLTSAPGRGTTFQMLLPCAGVAPGTEAARVARVAEPVPQTRAATVLIVEDEAPLRMAVSKMMRRSGIVVLEAADGFVALDIIRAHDRQIDVLLLDVTLVGAPSREVFEEASRLRPDTKVIVSSAYSEPEARAAVAGIPALFIRKPYQIGDLLAAIRDVLPA